MYRQVERGSGRSDQPSRHPASTEPLLEFFELLPDAAQAVPRSNTPLFDRDADIESIVTLLIQPNTRLVTISGPGGVGKTRVAMDVAHRVQDRFADGVVTISLAPIRTAAHVLPAIARATGSNLNGASNVERALIADLHEQHLLLVLDNCEQVVDVAPSLAVLLHGCPQLTILTTSRAPFRIAAEQVVPLAPLAVGDTGVAIGLPFPGAVELFLARVRQLDPTFPLDQRNVTIIQEICRRLDGLPLAIELAAARTAAVSPSELLERMDPSLPMLAHGHRDLPERQQTMRAAIAWSYDLLPLPEQRLFRWLSVFIGGFRLRAAEWFSAEMHTALGLEAATDADTLESISLLVASNLLQKTAGAGAEYRYAMLEVVREFGLELLQQHDELIAAQRAHAAWYAGIREWLDPNRFGSGERFIDHLWDIDAEHPNIRGALARSAALGDGQRVLEIAGNVAVFWHHRGFLVEGREWLALGLASAPDAPPETRAWGLAGLGLIQWTQGDITEAEPTLQEALTLANTLEHRELQALSLHLLALVDLDSDQIELARERIGMALSLWRMLDLPSDEAMALHILSSLPPAQGTPDHRIDEAQQALAIFEAIGQTSGVAFAYLRLGRLAQSAGNERRAADYFARSVAAWLSIDERWAIARPIVLLVELAVHHDRPHEGAMLMGAVEGRLRAAGAALSLGFRAIHDQNQSALIARLGAAAFERAVHAGMQRTPAEIDAAIASLNAQMFERALLSPREREVLGYIAADATDREIADALFLSPRTVQSHVGHILTKLDAPSRRASVKQAQELGLLLDPLRQNSAIDTDAASSSSPEDRPSVQSAGGYRQTRRSPS